MLGKKVRTDRQLGGWHSDCSRGGAGDFRDPVWNRRRRDGVFQARRRIFLGLLAQPTRSHSGSPSSCCF